MLLIPKGLREEIQEQIIENSLRGEQGWRFSNEDEDSLLGDFLGNLRTNKRYFLASEKEYEWEILYHKMRGRGPGAYEKSVGADAIITFEIKNKTTGKKTVKSLIFQAKKEGNNIGIKAQKLLMDNIAKDGNFIFTCGESGYFAQTTIGGEKYNIGQFLANQFIECIIGIENFEYDEKRELLFLNGVLIKRTKLAEVVVKVESN